MVDWVRSIVADRAEEENDELEHIVDDCINQDERCTIWAHEGRCYGINAAAQYFMALNCCPVCGSSGQLEFLDRR